MKLSEIAQAITGELVGLDADAGSFSTDTRTLQADDVFIALSGKRVNANGLLAQAAENAALAAITEHLDPSAGIAQIVVADSHAALGKLATAWCADFPKLIKVAITGSAGKTSTKEMTARIFEGLGNTLATQGNFNNDIGVPLTLLRLRAEHQYGVFELGANHIGEVAYTAAMVRPHAAVITNVGSAHLEGFGSRQGIAQAKGEIYAALTDDCVAVVNRDDAFAEYWLSAMGSRRVVTFSLNPGADIYASDICHGDIPQYAFNLHIGGQSERLQLQILGRHQVANALAAAGLAHACGVSLHAIVEGLSNTRPFMGRSVLHRLGESYLIDDTYNANPDSMKAAIDLLCTLPGRRVLVVGDMGELGDATASGHREVGAYAKMKKIDALLTTGEHQLFYAAGFGDQTQLFPDHNALVKALEHELQGVISALVKGSRSAHMERVVQAVSESAGAR
jgi:UDP-N-acetylmuramoyl-tripeptide--D-alanyl-D-alanine ligase